MKNHARSRKLSIDRIYEKNPNILRPFPSYIVLRVRLKLSQEIWGKKKKV